MKAEIEQWLVQLPFAEGEVGDGLVLTGWLLPTESGLTRIVAGELCLLFSTDDVLDVEPVGVTEQFGPTSASGALRVAIRRGAPLLDARPGVLSDGPRPPRRPFALATRLVPMILDPAPRFRELERQFLLDNSLMDT
jgi:hypothetical protein